MDIRMNQLTLLVFAIGLYCVQCSIDNNQVSSYKSDFGSRNIDGTIPGKSGVLNSLMRLSKYDWYKMFSKSKMGSGLYAKSNTTAKNFSADDMDPNSISVGDDVSNDDSFPDEIEGRRKHIKIKGKKKLHKLLYPILIGLVTAKSIIVPLIFKAVIILSKFSFFVSSLSFIISFILGIKVLLLSNNSNKRSQDNTRVEVVHVPLQQKYPSFHSSSSSGGWSDRDSENKFIPLQVDYDTQIYEKPYSSQEKDQIQAQTKDSYHPL